MEVVSTYVLFSTKNFIGSNARSKTGFFYLLNILKFSSFISNNTSPVINYIIEEIFHFKDF